MRRVSERLHDIRVTAEAQYLPEQSDPERGRYAFAYTITISNVGAVAARLLSRHWVITDANGKIQEVRGLGVVGEQPHLRAGESYRYTSGASIETPFGTMHGSYQMLADNGVAFDAPIAAFRLAVPTHTLH
jgi:ApaG protein